MKILDLDMDYFMDEVATGITDSCNERLSEENYSKYVWSKSRVVNFLEKNLGLSKNKKLPGRIVNGHNKAIVFWRELIANGKLKVPFEVTHVDSHADLGLGYSSEDYIFKNLLSYPAEERPEHNIYKDNNNQLVAEQIGDYLLFAIAYRWISKITYCTNPNGSKNDYSWFILKNFEEEHIWNKTVENKIQLLYNPNMNLPEFNDNKHIKTSYINKSKKEPEIPFVIIPTIEAVKYDGDFDYVLMATSPNYTPISADFIIDIFKEYIIEI